MNLYKNLLSDIDFNNLIDVLTSKYFPWYFYKTSLNDGKYTNDFMFVHTFYEKQVGINSPEFINILPLLNKVSATIGTKHTDLLRIKANLYTNQNKNITHEEHTDYPDLDSYTTAVYNLTTCNGATKFENKLEPSIANSLLVFDGNTMHSGITQSDTDIRLLVNFDFK